MEDAENYFKLIKTYQIRLRLLEERLNSEIKVRDNEILIHKDTIKLLKELIVNLSERRIIINNNLEARVMSDNQSNLDTFRNDLRGANIANFANQIRESAFQNASDFSQNISQNADEIVKLLQSLNKKAQDFPNSDERGEILLILGDLQEDISIPEKQKLERIKPRLKRLLAIATSAAILVAGGVDFSNNILELGEKLGIPKTELNQSSSQQLPFSN
ncbi:hypothetical protein LC653_31950 [Nostoc sp. CHAB 5784]|uniref:hypothetical protein n=1 Tax=Nostoc mirabile TaxID=2907820 RepID=UPI001E6024C6|nr:hypothetical protein [Nostoc mirabile]MCC5668350.1 hypothetical protein [Nostoc mirabile CHAB5784]